MSASPKQAHVWERNDLDWYVEGEDCTDALCTVERFVGQVWDPCCGQGNIVNALHRAGVSAWGSDIVERRKRPNPTGIDFLADAASRADDSVDNIMFNPPFFGGKGTEAFIRAAHRIVAGKLVCFADLKFLGSDGRAAGLFSELPPSRIWILTPRPSCPPGEYLLAGNKAGGGTADWVWIVWDKTAPTAGTLFGWLRRGALAGCEVAA